MANVHCFVIVCIDVSVYEHKTTVCDVFIDEAMANYNARVLNARARDDRKDRTYRVFKSLLHGTV